MIPLEYFGYAFGISMACLVWGAVWYALVDAVRGRPSRLQVAAWRWARKQRRECPQITQIFADGKS